MAGPISYVMEGLEKMDRGILADLGVTAVAFIEGRENTGIILTVENRPYSGRVLIGLTDEPGNFNLSFGEVKDGKWKGDNYAPLTPAEELPLFLRRGILGRPDAVEANSISPVAIISQP